MEHFASDYAEFSSGDNKSSNAGGAAHFTMDDLLDFPKDDDVEADAFLGGLTVDSGDSSTVTPVESCNSSVTGGTEPHCNVKLGSQFPGNELCVPYDDLAELEWLSNFVEESFSNEDLGCCLIPATTATTKTGATADTSSSITAAPPPPPVFPSDVSVPGKARSKRPRAPPCDWSSRVLHVAASQTSPTKKRESSAAAGATEATGRKCLHCASEKTPQWRTGPMGPKTLCNACGVRFKSGRLVPEYRPASSPTFVSNKHSNSHRKVLELRRQKEMQRQQQVIGGHVSVFNGPDEFLIHSAILNGQDLRHMM